MEDVRVWLLCAENVQYMRERGFAVHTFEAEMSDELTVRTGEEASPFLQFVVASIMHFLCT